MRENLTINGAFFKDMRMAFDALLTQTISKLLEKNLNEGAVKISLKIMLSENEDIDKNGNPETMITPSFEFSLSSEIKEKAKMDGNLGGENYRLTQNAGSGLYHIIQSGTIYDYLDGEDDED